MSNPFDYQAGEDPFLPNPRTLNQYPTSTSTTPNPDPSDLDHDAALHRLSTGQDLPSRMNSVTTSNAPGQSSLEQEFANIRKQSTLPGNSTLDMPSELDQAEWNQATGLASKAGMSPEERKADKEKKGATPVNPLMFGAQMPDPDAVKGTDGAKPPSKEDEVKPIPSLQSGDKSKAMASAFGSMKMEPYKGTKLDLGPDFKVSHRGPIIRPWEDPLQGYAANSDERIKKDKKPQAERAPSEFDDLMSSLNYADRAQDKSQSTVPDLYQENLKNRLWEEQKKQNPIGSTEKAIQDADAMHASILQRLSNPGIKSSPYTEAAAKPKAPGAPIRGGGEDLWAAKYLAEHPVSPDDKPTVPPAFDLTPIGYKPPQFAPSKDLGYQQDASANQSRMQHPDPQKKTITYDTITPGMSKELGVPRTRKPKVDRGYTSTSSMPPHLREALWKDHGILPEGAPANSEAIDVARGAAPPRSFPGVQDKNTIEALRRAAADKSLFPTPYAETEKGAMEESVRDWDRHINSVLLQQHIAQKQKADEASDEQAKADAWKRRIGEAVLRSRSKL